MHCPNMKLSVVLSVKIRDVNIKPPLIVLYVLWVTDTHISSREAKQSSPVSVGRKVSNSNSKLDNRHRETIPLKTWTSALKGRRQVSQGRLANVMSFSSWRAYSPGVPYSNELH